MLICLHGKGSNGREMKMYTGLNAMADTSGLIIAYPNAAGESWPYADSLGILKETVYLKDIIHYIALHYHGDTNSVYMSGMSSGGIFTFTFASMYPEALKGTAVVSGNITLQAIQSFEKSKFLLPPLLLIHGTGDFLYDGRQGVCISAEESLSRYISGCPVYDVERKWLPDTHPKDKCTVEKLMLSCPGNTVYYRIINGGHHWPGASFNAALFTSIKLGNYCKDFSANEAIHSFISAIETNSYR
jgi:poly(3-hydroxybutyrate) depolymerase